MRYKLYMLATAILIASGTVSSALGLLAPGPALPGNRSLRDRFSLAFSCMRLCPAHPGNPRRYIRG
jgi:hypothetical protein